jgi:hypothetical protein
MPNREQGCELSKDNIEAQFELEMRYQTSPAMGVLRLSNAPIRFRFGRVEGYPAGYDHCNGGWSDQFNIS